MKAMIFAAGLGTRLRPLTDNMPKALVSVGGMPMLERVMRNLHRAGVREFVVNTHHFAEMVEGFLARLDLPGSTVEISREEPKPFETGGAVRAAAGMLSGGRFLIHNVDILCNLDFGRFFSQDSPGNLATLLLREPVDDRCLLFDDGMRLAGWTNVRTGEVRSPYPDLDPAQCRRYSFCGIHMLSPDVPAMMQEWPECFSIIDFYLAHAASHRIQGVIAPPGMTLVDIGSADRLAEAERFIRNHQITNKE